MISYREMTIRDYEEISNLWKSNAGISFSDSDTYEHIAKYLSQNPGCSFVACDESRIIGTILCGDDARRGFINHLFVLPEYRNKGIGSELREMGENALKKRSATKVYVFVKNDNLQAIDYWKKSLYYMCDDFITMRKSLSDLPYQVYEELTEKTAEQYLVAKGCLKGPLTVKEFGDGNMNHIFRATGDGKSIILKQSMPHGKIDVSVFEPMDRAAYESAYIDYYAPFMGKRIEKHLATDQVMCANIYEDLSDMKVLRTCLLDGELRDNIGKEIGEYLALEYFYSSLFTLSIQRKKTMESYFSNKRMRQLTEDYILSDPFEDSPNNNIDSEIRPIISKLWDNAAACSRARELLFKFVTNKECLISGDFHPGNVFVGDKGCVFFDFDFATWGPISYDIGAMLGNLIIAYKVCHIYNPNKPYLKPQIKKLMVDMMQSFHNGMKRMLDGWDEKVLSKMLLDIEKDAIGYAAATIAGRTYGYARFKEIAMLDGKAERGQIIDSLVQLIISLLTSDYCLMDVLDLI